MEQTQQHPELHPVSQRLAEDEDILVGIAFGSMVNGTATPDSDLDVGVLCAGPLSADKRRALIHDLGQRTGRPVDLIDLRSAGVPVLREVLRHGVTLLCRDRRAHDGLITRLLVDTEDFLPYRQRILKERRDAWIG
ncbi:hypothetical protein CKO15_11105 [Halorhodospira abdelmalekii]|nr:hypothetical protein [Halorhodospira abdelmalekii]